MEIEAKFAVPNRAVYRELAHLRMLAGYTLVPVGVAQVADRYFDTADGRLLTGGYACRLRAEGDALIATLKGIGGVQGAVHRRAEEEVRLPAWSPDPSGWPASTARTHWRSIWLPARCLSRCSAWSSVAPASMSSTASVASPSSASIMCGSI